MTLPSHSGGMCVHGMVEFCPDCPPERMSVCEPDTAAPHAHVMRKREWPWVVVRRYKADGSLDWFTWHLTRWGARRAVALYLRTGEVKGIRP